MKILIHGINFAPELTGIGKYTGEMVAYLVKRGHQVRMITTPPYYPQWIVLPGYSGWRYQKENSDNLRVIRCPLWVPKNPGGMKRLLHHLSFSFSSLPVLAGQLGWKPDWILSIAPSIMNAPFDLLYSRLTGTRSWLHVQDFEIDAAFDLGMLKRNSFVSGFACTFEKVVFPGFDVVSTISTRMFDLAIQKGVPEKRMVYFTNWVDTDLIYPLDAMSPLRSELGISDETFIVLYAGNMGQKQGLSGLVEVARHLESGEKDILFVFCGAGSMLETIKADCAALTNVRFIPLQPLDKLNSLLNMADLHVLPQSENVADLVLPSKLSGMLASGRPVVATAKEGTQLYEIVSQVGIVVPPGDPLALSQAVREVAANSSLRAESGEASRKCAEMQFSKKKILFEFEGHLRQRANY
jgi:colanic acid biosynthesis glycosyl transferase WcaI